MDSGLWITNTKHFMDLLVYTSKNNGNWAVTNKARERWSPEVQSLISVSNHLLSWSRQLDKEETTLNWMVYSRELLYAIMGRKINSKENNLIPPCIPVGLLHLFKHQSGCPKYPDLSNWTAEPPMPIIAQIFISYVEFIWGKYMTSTKQPRLLGMQPPWYTEWKRARRMLPL